MAQAGKPTERYLEMQVKTASREQLLLMLFDGALRFTTQSREALAQVPKNFEAGHDAAIRAQRIVLELIASLTPAIGEPVYSNLVSLYRFVYRRLVEGNIRHELRLFDEALAILTSLRATWADAIQRLREERQSAMPQVLKPTGTGGAPVKGLSVQG